MPKGHTDIEDKHPCCDTDRCCIGECVPSGEGEEKHCSELGGVICEVGEKCSGEWCCC